MFQFIINIIRAKKIVYQKNRKENKIMTKYIFTGNYFECKAGNLISISHDKGKSAGFVGKALPQLAPKRTFWDIWRDNVGKISEMENNRYYVEEYYKEILSKVNIEELLKDMENPILLCYEKEQEFCHRHIVAEYIEIKYGVKVRDIKIDENLNIIENQRPEYIKAFLVDAMEKEKKIENIKD